ncbi:MAG: SH3 domain-containing protein [Usitatibacter sp.]
MRCATCLIFLIAFSARGAAPADSLVVAQGMYRAVDSDLHWRVRDGNHPKMGPIKVAISLDAHTSYFGTEKIVSTIYLSCEKKVGKIAVELTNARSDDLAGGLKLKEVPRLTCLGVAGPGALPPRSEIAAKWEANELGDVIARGLSPSELRACPSIEVREKILLPPALGREFEEVAVQVPTYAPGPDAVFTACGETSAYPPREVIAEKTVAIAPAEKPLAAATAPKPGAPPVEKLAPAPVAAPKSAAVPAQPPPAPTAPPAWQRAHTIPKGRSNIRRAPNINSAVVAQLPPGVRILVHPSVDDWWHVTSPSGATFEGYIRHDRFTLD